VSVAGVRARVRPRVLSGAAVLLLTGACSGGPVATTPTSVADTAIAAPSSTASSPTSSAPGSTSTSTSSPATRPSAVSSSTVSPVTAAPVLTEPEPGGVAADGTILALELLQAIVIENERGEGYSRSLFRHWSDLDRDGCNTREEVLIRQSATRAQVDPYGCTVVTGDWLSLYDGIRTDNPGDLDIDHVVALKEAWDSGAWDWSSRARELFANDLTDERSLIAVTSGSNRSKSDKDPSNWMPPDDADWCRYLGDWVSIKYRWNLAMDSSEFGRVRNLLQNTCSGWRVLMPSPPPIDVPPAGSGEGEGTAPTTVAGGDVYYANCAAARAAGAAPIYEGDPGYRPGLDRDRDGVACE